MRLQSFFGVGAFTIGQAAQRAPKKAQCVGGGAWRLVQQPANRQWLAGIAVPPAPFEKVSDKPQHYTTAFPILRTAFSFAHR
jgi:hypothetical protein